jgi:hypothetical protein
MQEIKYRRARSETRHTKYRHGTATPTLFDDEKHRRGQRLIAVSRLDREAGELPPLPTATTLLQEVGSWPEFLHRPAMHFLPLWLNELLLARVLTLQHVAVHVLLALIFYLVGTTEIAWVVWFPQLLHFSTEVFYSCKSKGYLLFRGLGFDGQGHQQDIRVKVLHVDSCREKLVSVRIEPGTRSIQSLSVGAKFWDAIYSVTQRRCEKCYWTASDFQFRHRTLTASASVG